MNNAWDGAEKLDIEGPVISEVSVSFPVQHRRFMKIEVCYIPGMTPEHVGANVTQALIHMAKSAT